MATETRRGGLARETGRGLRFAESAMATPRRAPDLFQQLSWQELQCRWRQQENPASRIWRQNRHGRINCGPCRLLVYPCGGYALARFLDYQCDEDASFARSNVRVALWAIMGAVAAHGVDAIKDAAETLPFGGFKESEVAAFLAPGWNYRARQRTLAGVAFRRRARDTPRLRPRRAGRIIPRRGVSLEEGP